MTADLSASQAAALKADRVTGIGLMCMAVTVFAFLDATAKYCTVVLNLPAGEVIWLRYVVHMIIMIAYFGPRRIPQLIRPKRPGLQALRSLFLLSATGFNFLALQYLQLDQTITIFFLSPLIVAALAGPLLNEWVGWRRMLAIMTGFAGIIFVTKPGFGGIHWAVIYSFAATLGYALLQIVTRYLAGKDDESVTNFVAPFAGIILIAPFAIVDWVWPQSWQAWLALASLGFFGWLGHWFLIRAHGYAPAPILAPFVYAGLISMIILGYVIFGDVPDAWTLLGGAIIIGSGLYLYWRERKAA